MVVRWLLGCIVAGLMAGCASTPSASPPAPAPADTQPSPDARVLGRSERFVIYQPAPGDSLGSIAQRFLGSESRGWVIADFNGISRAEPEQPLVVPLKPINPLGVSSDSFQTVPILCYHRFGNGGGKMVMSGASFAQQLDWLANNDYHVIPLAQLTEFFQGHRPLPKRSVVITIDDGYESTQRIALPLLRKYGFPATVFVYTDFIGAADALSWPQLHDLVDSGLIDVQAHSKTHRNMIERDAAQTDDGYRLKLDIEARVPRELLERRLGVQVQRFAYPYGDANQAVLDALTRQHYQLGLTVNPGGNAFFAQPLMLRRTMIYGDQDLASFKLKLQTVRGVGAS
jgi:peptidoglycan/xylan/chitin deacetylase (PgdA/CDA1 family)